MGNARNHTSVNSTIHTSTNDSCTCSSETCLNPDATICYCFTAQGDGDPFERIRSEKSQRERTSPNREAAERKTHSGFAQMAPQEVLEMNWLVDVFDRESVRREMLRCMNECSVTLIRQVNEMSNR